jgi:hypothetical protein
MADGSKRLVKVGESQEFVLSGDQDFMATVRGLVRQPVDRAAESESSERVKESAVID